MRKTNTARTKVRLAMLIAACAMASTACRGMVSSKPPRHPNPNMDNVSRIDAQEPFEHDGWADGRGMRMPPENTVAIGELRDDPHMYQGLVAGEFATTTPMALDAALLERGHERYEIFCVPCHGSVGDGAGTVPTRAGNWIVPTLHDERRRGFPVGQVFDVITNGANTMPAYAAQVPVEDRWAIAAYVRALQISQGIPLAQVPSDVAAAQGWGQ